MKIKIKIGIPSYMLEEYEIDDLKNYIIGEYLDKFTSMGVTKKDINLIIEPTNGDFYTRISGIEEENTHDTLEQASPVSSKTIEAEEPVNLKEVLTKEEKVKEQVEDYDNTDITESKEKICKDDDNIIMRDSCDECCEENTCMCKEDEFDLGACCCDNDNNPWYGGNGYDGGDCSGSCPHRELTRVGANIALLKLYLMLKYDCGWQELNTKYGSTHLDGDEKEFLLYKLFESTGLDTIAKEVEKTLDK